jgi:hypothetical protein
MVVTVTSSSSLCVMRCSPNVIMLRVMDRDWQDLLAERVRELEAGADPMSAEKTLVMLRVIRGYETRLRQLTLRLDYRLARSLKRKRPSIR